MEENKDLINNSAEEEIEQTVTKVVEVAEVDEVVEDAPKKKKAKKLKNQAAFKRGTVSLAVTAIFLAALIVVNVLVSALSERFSLSFDMTTQKVNTISEENIEFIKEIEDEVSITVFATKDNFVDYMSYYSENYYYATSNTDYFEQTLSLVEKYEDYNKNIKVSFIDPQSTEYTAFSSNYPSMEIIPGDMFIECKHDGISRQKKIGFTDIYSLTSDQQQYNYGYSTYTITGNNIETALTSAIAYAVSDDVKKVAFLTGHSVKDKDYTTKYQELLEDNNYEVDIISDTVIKSISDEYDMIVIMAPAIDFMSEELDIISGYLDNEGKLGKGLMFFGDASYPTLPNLSEFMVQWGIEISDGILYETDEDNRSSEDPCTMYIYPLAEDITDDMSACITGYNVPIQSVEPASDTITTTEYMMTTESVVVAPVGTTKEWSDYSDEDKAQFVGVMGAKKIGEGADGVEVSSYMFAFSSIEYIQSYWAEYSQLANKDITLRCTEIAANVSEQQITFVAKTITDESFIDSISEGGTSAIRTIFMILLPLALVVLGIYIYIRRRNA